MHLYAYMPLHSADGMWAMTTAQMHLTRYKASFVTQATTTETTATVAATRKT